MRSKPTWLGLGLLVATVGCPKGQSSAADASTVVADGGAVHRDPGDPIEPGHRPPHGLAPGAAAGPLRRPPHPAMATSNHGLGALQALATAVTAPVTPVSPADGLRLLASGGDGSAAAARDVFVHLWSQAQEDRVRAQAAGGVMAALVLDPAQEGYRERLTDAYGMQLYAGALGTVTGSERQLSAARALVLAAAGRFRESNVLCAQVATGNTEPYSRWLEGVARHLMGQGGSALAALDAATKAQSPLPHALLERARVQLALGNLNAARVDAQAALKASPKCSPCRLVAAQALALDTDAGDARTGLEELSALTASKPPEPVLVEALATAAVGEARAGNTAGTESLAVQMRSFKSWPGETALAEGLAAHLAGEHKVAATSLETASRALPSGLLRREALRALAVTSVQANAPANALKALEALEGEAGGAADSATQAAGILAAMGDSVGAAEEHLRAYVLDPYSPEVAKAAGLKPRAGGAAASAKAAQLWRLVGGGAAQPALTLAGTMEKTDPNSPYLAWSKLQSQLQLDAQAPVGTEANNEAALLAVDVVNRCGKQPVHTLFPVSMRAALVAALDSGDRGITGGALKVMAKDKETKVAQTAQEAASRAPRPNPKQTR